MFILLKMLYPPSSLLSKNQLLAESRTPDKYREILETSRWEITSAAGTQICFWRDQTDRQTRSCKAVLLIQKMLPFHLLKPATNYSRICQKIVKWFIWFCCLMTKMVVLFIYLLGVGEAKISLPKSLLVDIFWPLSSFKVTLKKTIG